MIKSVEYGYSELNGGLRKMRDTNRRRNIRVPENIEMNFMIIDKINPGIIEARELLKIRKGTICDFSSTGMSMKTTELISSWISHLNSGEFLIGTIFELPGSSVSIRAITKAMWIKKEKNLYQLGLKFIEINNFDLVRIRECIIHSNLKK